MAARRVALAALADGGACAIAALLLLVGAWQVLAVLARGLALSVALVFGVPAS